MSEFTNRMAVQREILRLVNSKFRLSEAIYGLSPLAIERWSKANRIHANAEIVRLLYAASNGLHALANKSQEQITEDYGRGVENIRAIIDSIATLSITV